MTVDQNKGYRVFTEEMKHTHTILVPNMLPMHFKIIGKVMEKVGYRASRRRASSTSTTTPATPPSWSSASSSTPSRAGSMTRRRWR